MTFLLNPYRHAGGGGPSYDSDASAYFAAMSVQPDATRKGLIDTLIVGLKADGLWTLLDWLLLCAAHDAQAGRVNAKAPSKVASAVNSPTFTTDRGFAGDGATAYLDIGEGWSASSNFTQNSSTLGVWCNLQGSGSSSVPQIGQAGSARQVINARGNAGNETFRINATSDATLQANTGSRTGHRMGTRTVSTDTRGYFNGSEVASLSHGSASIQAGNGVILRGNASYTSDRVAAAYSGAGLDATQAGNLHSRISTFLTAIGAN